MEAFLQTYGYWAILVRQHEPAHGLQRRLAAQVECR
jgi:hypothetical protein